MNQNKHETLTQIARDAMNVSTLETRGRDALDFHDLSAATVAAGLSRAFDAGAASAIESAGISHRARSSRINAEVSARDLRERVAHVTRMLQERINFDAGLGGSDYSAFSIRHTLAGIARDAAELNAALAAIEALESLTPNPGA